MSAPPLSTNASRKDLWKTPPAHTWHLTHSFSPPETTPPMGYPAASMLCLSFPSTWTKLNRANPKNKCKELTPSSLITQIFIMVVLLFSLFFQLFPLSLPPALIYLTLVYKEPHMSWSKEVIN